MSKDVKLKSGVRYTWSEVLLAFSDSISQVTALLNAIEERTPGAVTLDDKMRGFAITEDLDAAWHVLHVSMMGMGKTGIDDAPIMR